MYERLREAMVKKLVVEAGIQNPAVISAMRRVPRHVFVDAALGHQAYGNGSLPIGFGQTISHPTTVAVMSSLLDIQGGEKVLEIGTGSGYQAAVLAEMGAKVFTIERIQELANRSRTLLEKLGYYSIAVKIGDGTLGWNEFAPYDRIIVTAGAPAIPENLAGQLNENGKLIIPVGKPDAQKLNLIEKKDGQLSLQTVPFRRFVPLIGQKGWTT
ncbi:MAG: protein-L-isoaspartate(D-aspartate) O-methyltransferase [Calditrichaeota bacterium]|nr:protein-L-isoaspartate(D-aspartate) O-methyltransferase [Calditrichota bacterium]RQV98110.1 MAG: protein-L-isoaspartate(D-aspartate) O-methyltransferase [Calditrichota bacterium]